MDEHGAGPGRYLSNETVNRVAQRTGRTPAQVLLGWCLQHGLPVIPKSTQRERIFENAQIFDFALSDDDMGETQRARPDQRQGPGRGTQMVGLLRQESLGPSAEHLAYLAEGGAHRDAGAKQLHLSRNTVRTHMRNLMAKLGVHSMLEVVALTRGQRGLA